MTISAVETFVLRYTPPEVQGNAFGYSGARAALLVRIRTSDGLVGWGETWRHPEIAAEFVERIFAPKLIGVDPMDRERLFHELYASAVGYDRQGAFLASLSSVDIALWDLAGKIAGQPVAKLIGGLFRSRVEAYASGPFLPPPGDDAAAHYAREAEAYARSGLKAIKIRAGLSPETDRVLADAVRKGAGPDARIAVDFNQAYDRIEAVRSLQALCEHDLLWAEEPVAPDDIDGYLYVKERTTVPIAGGESEATVFAFRRLLERRALDIVQPDISIAGGFTECIRIRHLAEAWRIRFIPHVWGSGIGVAATLQLLASAPPYSPTLNPLEPMIEWDRSPNPFREELTANPLRFDGPFMIVPDGPGLGIEVNEDMVRRYRVQ